MPNESEQRALSQIKDFLEAGHTLDAIRVAGWADWIDHLQAEGYDLKTGQLALRPPEDTPVPGPIPVSDEGTQATEDSGTPLTSDTRPLQEEIARRSSRGWQLISHVGTEAQMRKPKHFSFAWAFLWFLLLGVGLIVYLLWHWSKKEEVVYLRMVDGHVDIATKGGLFELLAKPVKAWWTWSSHRQTTWAKAVAYGGPPLAIVLLIIAISSASGGNDQMSAPTDTNSSSVLTESKEPEPTQKPASSEGPSNDSSLVSECLAFNNNVIDSSTFGALAMGRLTDLILDASIDPLILLTPGWQNDVRVEYRSLRQERDNVASLNAPTDSYREIKDKIVEGFDLILASEKPLLDGADNFDPSLVEEATDYMSSATDSMTAATVLLERFDPTDCTG